MVLAVTLSTTDWAILAAIAFLFLLSIILAVAETALTRVSKAKAQRAGRDRADVGARCCCRWWRTRSG